MGRGKRIENFRNLNLDSWDEQKNKKRKETNQKKTSSMKEMEFVIEVEEKPSNHSNKEKKTSYKKEKKPKQSSPIEYHQNKNEKKQKEKSKSTSIIVSSFLLIFVLIGVVAGCLVTPTFDIAQVEVENGKNVTSSEVQRYFSGVKGKNMFLMNTHEMEKKIEEHPYIYKAKIKRQLPDKLLVTYIERKPYAIVKYIESYVLLDKYGSILEIKKENENQDLPIIYGIEEEDFTPGEKLTGIARLKFENTVYLLETADHIDFGYTITEINYTDVEEIALSIAELDVEIIYGEMEKEILNDKMTYLNEIFKKLAGKKGTLDISSSNYSEKVIFTEILK